MNPDSEFLTSVEAAEVDAALLTARDKFTARIALYALRSLKQIGQRSGQPIADLTPQQIEDWVYQDHNLQMNLDREFKPFFTQLVVASIQPLTQAAQVAACPIEHLSVPQVITWFEQQAKAHLLRS